MKILKNINNLHVLLVFFANLVANTVYTMSTPPNSPRYSSVEAATPRSERKIAWARHVQSEEQDDPKVVGRDRKIPLSEISDEESEQSQSKESKTVNISELPTIPSVIIIEAKEKFLTDFDKQYAELGPKVFKDACLADIFEIHPENDYLVQQKIDTEKLKLLIAQRSDLEPCEFDMIRENFFTDNDNTQGQEIIDQHLQKIFQTAYSQDNYKRMGRMLVEYPYAIWYENFSAILTPETLAKIIYSFRSHASIETILDALYTGNEVPDINEEFLLFLALTIAISKKDFVQANNLTDFLLPKFTPELRTIWTKYISRHYRSITKRYPLNDPRTVTLLNNICMLNDKINPAPKLPWYKKCFSCCS